MRNRILGFLRNWLAGTALAVSIMAAIAAYRDAHPVEKPADHRNDAAFVQLACQLLRGARLDRAEFASLNVAGMNPGPLYVTISKDGDCTVVFQNDGRGGHAHLGSVINT